jgi:ribosomal protein S18 acetylase RimI-like enzyme
MSFAIRSAIPADLPALAALAERCQADPQRHCGYLSEDAAAIAGDVAEVVDWANATLVALDDERNIIGWLLAETDPDMSRVWWWGPFVGDADVDDQLLVAGALLGRGLQNHPDHDEHEIAVDRASTLFATLADQQGFVGQEGSLVLRLDRLHDVEPVTSTSIHPITAGDPAADDVAALHDETFPGTHSTGEMLLRDVDADHVVYAAVDSDSVIGYVAVESQLGGSFYIDYLGVATDQRQRGIGRNLVVVALGNAPADRTHANLTVREGNVGARRLYASLGFTEERILAPYRLGFTID